MSSMHLFKFAIETRTFIVTVEIFDSQEHQSYLGHPLSLCLQQKTMIDLKVQVKATAIAKVTYQKKEANSYASSHFSHQFKLLVLATNKAKKQAFAKDISFIIAYYIAVHIDTNSYMDLIIDFIRIYSAAFISYRNSFQEHYSSNLNNLDNFTQHLLLIHSLQSYQLLFLVTHMLMP